MRHNVRRARWHEVMARFPQILQDDQLPSQGAYMEGPDGLQAVRGHQRCRQAVREAIFSRHTTCVTSHTTVLGEVELQTQCELEEMANSLQSLIQI